MSDKTRTPRMEDLMMHEHRSIREATQLLEAAPDLPVLLARLASFRSLLVAHFGSEESPGGFFDTVRESAGRHVGKVAALAREHETLLEAADRLAASARACLAGPVADTLRQASAFAERLRQHEVAENELLVDALYVDIGVEE